MYTPRRSMAPIVAPNSRSTRASRRAAASVDATALFVGVDLGPLELARVIDVDRLPFREEIQGRLARLAVAVARVLHAAERQVHLGSDRPGVDVGDAGLQVTHRSERLVHVTGED